MKVIYSKSAGPSISAIANRRFAFGHPQEFFDPVAMLSQHLNQRVERLFGLASSFRHPPQASFAAVDSTFERERGCTIDLRDSELTIDAGNGS